jgi:DNA-binding NarL/FixJ family response regulator
MRHLCQKPKLNGQLIKTLLTISKKRDCFLPSPTDDLSVRNPLRLLVFFKTDLLPLDLAMIYRKILKFKFFFEQPIMTKIRVVLIEDHDLSRVGLIAALQRVEGIEVVGDAANARQGLQILEATKPDVAIVDIGLPDMDGIELTQKFKQGDRQTQKTKVLILTMHNREDSVLAAFAAGADSYSLKDVSLDNLVQAIQTTHEGNAWIDPTIARVVLKQARRTPSAFPTSPRENDSSQKIAISAVAPEYQQLLHTSPLTERELQVLELIVGGCNNAQIAEKLYITVGTVKTHVRSILNKLCADDRTQAAVRALRSGLVQ